IFDRVTGGYLDRSPRGVPRTFWRCDDLSEGGRLAARPELVEGEDGRKRVKVLIETRHGGHIALIPPTPAACHKLNRPYVQVRGGLATIATITPAERKRLLDIARTFDEMPPEEPRAARQPARDRGPADVPHALPGESPADHFNRVCTVEDWQAMLTEWRWEYVGDVSGRPHCWVHAEATSCLSAHLTANNSLLVYSTSTRLAAWGRESRTTHTPFFVYAHVAHDGNLKAAAAHLRRLGFGAKGGRR
ncbi:MAG TPA: hypothetical protein VM597_06475, partial [Gemmataceae bacterium]|nr:hypothetical protein [Gemmataceae bacterium]